MAKKISQPKEKTTWIYILYAFVIIAFAILWITNSNNIIFALTLIAIVIIAELKLSAKSEGLKKTLFEAGASIIIAIAAVLIIPSIILHTSAPIDVVASCSMLPVMHRGDLVVLSGITNMTQFLQKNKIPVVNVSQATFSTMLNNMNSEFVEPFAYFSGNRSAITLTPINGSAYSVGFYSVSCINTYTYLRQPYNYNKCYVNPYSLSNNLIKYNYSIGRLQQAGQNLNVVYVSSITIGNTTLTQNYSNPIIVYRTTSSDYFSGDIIHRLYVAIRVGNNYYLLTKGDNNLVLDIEAMNYPINMTNVVGSVVADVPYLGYPSLIIKGQIGSVPGCNQVIVR